MLLCPCLGLTTSVVNRGSHRQRHPLHDLLPDAHSEEIAGKDAQSDAAIFGEAEGAIDVPLSAGDLIIADARLLHAAWPNTTPQRRTCILAWHNCFDFPNPPSWWQGDIPQEIIDFAAAESAAAAAAAEGNAPYGEEKMHPAPPGDAYGRTPRREAQEAAAAANARL